MADREISEGRKLLFIVGQVLFVLGLLSVGSVFFSVALSASDLVHSSSHMDSIGPRFVLGAAMVFLGRLLKSIGRMGLAGSGVVLDPAQAREDLEPWSRMAGGVIKDGLDEAGVDIGVSATREPDFADRLRKLHALHQEGILSDEEYAREKAEALERD